MIWGKEQAVLFTNIQTEIGLMEDVSGDEEFRVPTILPLDWPGASAHVDSFLLVPYG